MKKHIDKSVFGALFFSLFATITGVGIVVPLLPVYAHQLGASGIYIGLIFGSFSISRTILLPYFGKLSDKKGRKPFIVTGLFFYFIISLAFTLTSQVEGLIILRFFQGMASAMIMPVAQAYVGDIAPVGSEGLTMGFFNMSTFLGLSLGPIIGGVLNDGFGINMAFFSMGGLSLFAFLFSFFYLPPVHEEINTKIKSRQYAWVELFSDDKLLALFIFRLAYACCIGIVWGFLPVLASIKLSCSSSTIGVLIMIAVFITGIIHSPMGILADRTNKVGMVVFGGLIVGGAILSLEWAASFERMVISCICFGFGGGIAMPGMMALAVIKGNDYKAMGAVMSIITLAHSIGMLLGAFIAGIMMDLFELQYAFSIGALIMVLGTTMLVMTYSMKKEKL